MRVHELIEKLKLLPQDKSILCQVVPVNSPGAWNMRFEFLDVDGSWMVVLQVSHPDLKTLPKME